MNIDLNKRNEYTAFGKLNGGDSFLFGGYRTVYVKFEDILYDYDAHKKRNAIDLISGTCIFVQDGDLVIPLTEKFTYNQQG